MSKFKLCSLFAGIGGIDLGFEQAGFKTVFANEFDAGACINYRKNFPNNVLAEGDICQIDAKEIPDFDVLAAGFPCQPFSVCGKQKGFSDERGNLFFEICRIIDVKNPKTVFLENVANLVRHDNGNTFRVIQDQLEGRGYSVKYWVADACDYGLPQHRTRVYIVCFRNESNGSAFQFPEDKAPAVQIMSVLNPHEQANEQLYLSQGSKKYERLQSFIKDRDQLYRFSDFGIQQSKDGISFTLKANMGTWYDREPIMKDDCGIRKLSPKECLLIQGFPTSFIFPEYPDKAAYKQAGNTVCVPVVKLIAQRISSALEVSATGDLAGQTLIGVLKNNKQREICVRHKFYHIPVRKLPIDPNSVKFVALLENDKSASIVKLVGRVRSVQEVFRSEITELPKQSNERYYRLEVAEWMELPEAKPKVFRGVFETCDISELL